MSRTPLRDRIARRSRGIGEGHGEQCWDRSDPRHPLLICGWPDMHPAQGPWAWEMPESVRRTYG